jgi:hypothetical protein
MARGDVYEDTDAVDAEAKTDGLASGLVIVTTLLLLGALIVMQNALKKHFGENWFSKETAASATE